MTIDRKISYKLHEIVEKYPIKGGKKLANTISKLILPIPKGRIVVDNRNGQKVILNPRRNKGVDLSIFYTGLYEPGVINVMRKVLDQGDTFMEIGANIAPLSMSASEMVGGNGQVYAFEPDPTVVRIINANIKLNSLQNISAVNIGLGDKESEMMLYLKPEINRGASSLIKEPGDRSVKVKIQTLDRYVKSSGIKNISMMVIDVEGWEEHVLKGGLNTIKRDSPLISMEFNSKYNPQKLYEIIKKLGIYNIYSLRRSKDYVSKLRKVQSFKDLKLDDNAFFLTPKHEKMLQSIIG